ncbi:hypothetical protein DPMN_109633 [Dreissena polymorpha]|uniref:Uncharacterized protein n=1 Tax=Dreissena polymorpha TaxID=45954 RepID=A0A9D4QM67_DREPO|nr:hypothetical protein DPMN_109633 [Dreissena polymorpha]
MLARGSEVRDQSRSQLMEEERRKECGKECPVRHEWVIFQRQHMENCNLPTVFCSRAWDKLNLDGDRYSGVMSIIRNLGFRSIDEVMIYLHPVPLAIPAESCPYERNREKMERICQRFFWHIPAEFHVSMVNSRALLFHWRVLAAILCLGGAEVTKWLELVCLSRGCSPSWGSERWP